MAGIASYLTDKLQNLVANLGTSRDKAAGSRYVANELTPDELQTAYRYAWLPRKIVDIPAFDATRRWRTWNADAEDISAIEAEERRLDIRRKVLEARIMARLYGGSAIYFDTGVDASKPLEPSSVKRGGIRFAAVVSRFNLNATRIVDDPLDPRYGMPEAYRVGSSEHASVIHPSRLVVFNGNQNPASHLGATASVDGWGDSVLQAVYEQLLQTDSTSANIASLVFEAKVDVVKIPNFMQGMTDPDYRDKVLDRMRLASIAKGNNGTLLLDAEESYEQKQLTFASLPEVVQVFLQMASGAADIPMTRLLGQSPAGMNATGESDLKNYYDRISAEQELFIGPALERFDEALIRSALGARPEGVDFQWASLWQLSDSERAEIGEKTANAIKTVAETQLVPAEPLGRAAVNALTESGTMPGLDTLVAEFEENNPLEEEAEPGETRTEEN